MIDRFHFSRYNLWNFYNEGMIEDFVQAGNCGCHLRFASLNLPKLIVRAHTVGLLAELPVVKISLTEDGDQEDASDILETNITRDLSIPISNLLALGVIFIVPYTDSRDNLKYETVSYNDFYKNIKYYEEDDNLKYLFYRYNEPVMLPNGKIEVRSICNEHYIDEQGIYRYEQYYMSYNEKIYLNGNDGTKAISDGWQMLPFKVELKINADAVGWPIWYNAKHLIEDCNIVQFELMQELDVNRTIVAIPEGLTETNVRGDKTTQTLSRRFTVIKGLDEDNEIKVYGGGYDPTGHYTTLNNTLSLVSLQCGLGNEYLRFDKQGGMKTAKEVIYSQNDTYINREILTQTLDSILRKLVSAFYYMKFQNRNPYVAIQFEDSVYNSNDDYLDRVQAAFDSGAITKEEYIKKIFPNDEDMLEGINLDNEMVE